MKISQSIKGLFGSRSQPSVIAPPVIQSAAIDESDFDTDANETEDVDQRSFPNETVRVIYPAGFDPEEYRTDGSAPVNAALTWITTRVTKPKLKHYRADGKEVLGSEVVTAFYSAGETGVTGRRLMKALAHAWVLDGNAYLQIVRDSFGNPSDLIYRSPADCKPVQDRNTGRLIGYRIGADIYDPSDLIHFGNGLDPQRPLQGLSPLHKIARTIAGAAEAEKYVHTVLENHGMVGLAYIPDAPLPPADAAYMRAQLDHYTAANRGKSFVASKKGSFQKVGGTPNDIALSELKRDFEAAIAGNIGIPAVVCQMRVGIESSTYSNYDEAITDAYEGVMIPLWDEWAEALTLQYLTQFRGIPKGDYLEFDLADVAALHESEDDRKARVTAHWESNLIDRSTANTLLGYEVTAEDQGLYYAQVSSGLLAPDQIAHRSRMQMNRRAFEQHDESGETH